MKRLPASFRHHYYKSSAAYSPEQVESLGPQVITDEKERGKIQPYLDNLHRAFNNPDIWNIAIMGSFGSGKSTIIKNFQHQNTSVKCLTVSLASFAGREPGESKEQLERKLEISILQQIFYHVKPSSIPDSRFKRIRNFSNWELFLLSITSIAWLYSALVLFAYNHLTKLNPANWSVYKKIDWWPAVAAIIFFTGLAFIVRKLVRLFSNSKISKLNIKGELELGENIEKSVFNQHLEEILYFFERTTFQAVIIEDLDRFESIDIFVKLREVNTLINKSESIQSKVKFVYAIRDDLFRNPAERVKFFDYIIPVIPFINSSNAVDQLTQLIARASLPENVLSREFKDDVCSYMNEVDMRLLRNIFNEFVQYKSFLPEKLSPDNLFAIIVYKNLYPDDFGLLLLKKGNLYSKLSGKRELALNHTIVYSDKIRELEIQIKLLESERIEALAELRRIYLGQVLIDNPGVFSFFLDQEWSFDDLIASDQFGRVLSSGNLECKRYAKNYSGYWDVRDKQKLLKPFSVSEMKISSAQTYANREEIIIEKKENRIEKIREEIAAQSKEMGKIQSASLKDILKLEYSSATNKSETLDPLVRYFLLNGYIDEDFWDYISVVHEVTLSRQDIEFERDVKAGRSYDFGHSLYNPDKIVARMQERFFELPSILNFEILDVLLADQLKYPKKRDYFFETLFSLREKLLDFVKQYIERPEAKVKKVIPILVKGYPGFWKLVQDAGNMPIEEKRQFARWIVHFSQLEAIKRLEGKESLDELVCSTPAFFDEWNIEIYWANVLKYLSDGCSYKISVLHQPANLAGRVHFEQVYKAGLFAWSRENISEILHYFHIKFDVKEFWLNPITSLSDKPQLTDLYNYIWSDIAKFLKQVWLPGDEAKYERSEIIARLLNDSSIQNELIEQVLEKQLAVLGDATEIKPADRIKLVFNKNKVEPAYKNLFYWMELEGVSDQEIADYLQQKLVAKRLSEEDLVVEGNEEPLKRLAMILLSNESIDKDIIEILVTKVKTFSKEVPIATVTNNGLDALLRQNMLELSRETVDNLKSRKDKHYLLRLLQKNFDTFIDNVADYDLEIADWSIVFSSSVFSKFQKADLAEKLLKVRFSIDVDIAEIIIESSSRDNFVLPSAEVIVDLIAIDEISDDKRLSFLLQQAIMLDDEDIRRCVTSIDSRLEDLFTGNPQTIEGPFLPKTELLLSMLTERHLLAPVELDLNEDRSIRAITIGYSADDEE